MLFKLRQGITRYQLTSSNRLPARRARQFLVNQCRLLQQDRPSAPVRATLGLLAWMAAKSYHKENRIAFRASCFITGRARGTSQRFTVARTRIKRFSNEGKLFGVRKSSW